MLICHGYEYYSELIGFHGMILMTMDMVVDGCALWHIVFFIPTAHRD